jgi:hypothetical protein
MASTGLKSSSKVLKEFAIKKRTQLWQYLNTSVDFFLRSVGLRTTKEILPGATSSTAANLELVENETFVLGGVPYKKYVFHSWMVLSGANAYVQDMGLINVSQGFMLITDQSTNIVADDTAGIGGFTNGAIANGGTLVEDNGTSITQFATLAYVNQDNTLTGVDDNYMYLILANTGLVSLEAEAYVKFEFVVEQAANVEFIQF